MRRSGRTTDLPRADRDVINVDGQQVTVSHLDKVLYPKAGFTKAQVVDYYLRVAPVLLPHLRDRPLTLKRYPNGVEAPFFYEKHCPKFRPKWVDTATVWSKENEENISFCVINNLPTLIWAANLGDLELHTSLARQKNMDCPTSVVFDLDPGPPANILQCAEVGLWLRTVLEKLGLQCWAKTSGSKGLQVYVPLNRPATYEVTRPFARKLAESLAEQRPDLVVSQMRRSLRQGKVLVDWSQNDRHKTTVCVYSLRAKEQPMVSTPVAWNEVAAALKRRDIGKLSFQSDAVLRRVEQLGDLFAPVLTLKQKLPAIEQLKS
ncbi:MAG: primase-like protein [Pedosphaera sp.]|nr:primase-like protein [Pedosphaera sp.]